MKNKIIVSLIAIVAIALVVMFSGCIGSKTPIHDIHENPDKYVDKEVTIKAEVAPFMRDTREIFGPRSPDCSGFWIDDIEQSTAWRNEDIFVAYDGTIPGEQRDDFKDEWGR